VARAGLTATLLTIVSALLLVRTGEQAPSGLGPANPTPKAGATAVSGAASHLPTGSREPGRSDAPPAGRASPAAPPPAGPAGFTIVSSTVKSWPGPGVTRAQVLVKLRNDAPTPLEFVPSGSRYRILASTGREVASGVFTYAVPDSVGPGEHAYLVETVSALLVAPGTVERVEVRPLARVAEQVDPLLTVRDVKWRSGAGGGLEASGLVTNGTSERVATGFVCVLFFDQADALVGAVYDLTDIRDVEPGASASFTTAYPGAPPIDPHQVASAKGIAFASGD
jgi:hypothetical protein